MADMTQQFEDGFAQQGAPPADAAPAEPAGEMRCPMCGASADKIIAGAQPPAPPEGGMGGMGGGGGMGMMGQ